MTDLEKFKALFDDVGQQYKVIVQKEYLMDGERQYQALILDPQNIGWYYGSFNFDFNGKLLEFDCGE